MAKAEIYVNTEIERLIAAHKPAGMDRQAFIEHLLGSGLATLERELARRSPGLQHVEPDPDRIPTARLDAAR